MFGRANPRRDSQDTKRAFWSILLAILLLVATVAVGLPVLINMAVGSSHDTYTVETTISGESAHSVSFSPDDSILAIGTENSDVEIYTTGDWNNVDTIPLGGDRISSVEFSHSGNYLAATESIGFFEDSTNQRVIIIDTSDWSIESTVTMTGTVHDVAWTNDDNHILVGDTAGVSKIEAGSWNIVDFQSESSDVAGLDIDSNGGTFAATLPGDPGTTNVRNVDDLSLIQSLNVGADGGGAFSKLDDSNWLAVPFGSLTGRVDVIETGSYTTIASLTENVSGNRGAIEFSPDDDQLAIGGNGNDIQIFSTGDWEFVLNRNAGGSNNVQDLTYSNSGERLAVAVENSDVVIYENTGVDLFSHDELSLNVQNWMDHGDTNSFTVQETRTSIITGETTTVDVTDEAMISSSDSGNLSVDSNNNTVTATSNEDFADQIILTAEYEGNVDNETVTVSNRSLPHIDILPPEHRLPAIFGPGIGDRTDATEYWPGAIQIQYLFAITFIGACIANRTGGFAGLAVIEIGVLMGYPLDFVSLGTVIASIFFTVFLFTQLASVTEFSGR